MPQFLPAATVKPDIFTLEGVIQRFFVHITQHQYHAGIGVLDDSRNQAFFIEFNVFNFSFSIHIKKYTIPIIIQIEMVWIPAEVSSREQRDRNDNDTWLDSGLRQHGLGA